MASEGARMRKNLQGLRLLWLVGIMGLPATAMAANNCAWINEATASGLLGGGAVGEVSGLEAEKRTICTFTQRGAGVIRTLQVTVEISTDPHERLGAIARICGTEAAALKAIGNEALVCPADDRKGGLGERVVGRVRDQVFTITMATTLKNDQVLSRNELKSRIYTAAEQVAGNLF